MENYTLEDVLKAIPAEEIANRVETFRQQEREEQERKIQEAITLRIEELDREVQSKKDRVLYLEGELDTAKRELIIAEESRNSIDAPQG